MVKQIIDDFADLKSRISEAEEDVIDFLHFILYHLDEPKNQSKRDHILRFDGFPFGKETEVYFIRRNIVLGFMTDGMQEKICNLLDIQIELGNKMKTVVKILDYFYLIFSKETTIQSAEELCTEEEMYEKFNDQIKMELHELCELHERCTDLQLKFDMLVSIESWGKKREHVKEKLQEIRLKKRDVSRELYWLSQRQCDIKKFVCHCPNGAFSSQAEHNGDVSELNLEDKIEITVTPAPEIPKEEEEQNSVTVLQAGVVC